MLQSLRNYLVYIEWRKGKVTELSIVTTYLAVADGYGKCNFVVK